MGRVIARADRSWKLALLDRLRMACLDTPFADSLNGHHAVGVHLAVFVEPYLSFLLHGQKTVESRFSINKHAPYEQVGNGDILVLKKSSGPVCGLCRITNVWFYRLDASSWLEIERYAQALCMDGSVFWQKKRGASFATLMQVDAVRRLEEFDIDKDDPRSWVVVRPTPASGQGTLLL
jgi:hypothetical protein